MFTNFSENLTPTSAGINCHTVDSTNFTKTFLLLLTICIGTRFWGKKQKFQSQQVTLKKLPGPRRYPFFGSLLTHEIRYIVQNPTKLCLDCIKNLTKTYGNVFCVWVMNEPKVVIADAELAINLFNDGTLSGKATDTRRAAKIVGGDGLLMLPPETHALRRRKWLPAFNRSQIKNSIKFFNQQAIRLCEDLSEYQFSGESFDMLPFSVGCTFRAICYSAFGQEYMSKLPESVSKNHMHDLHTLAKNLTEQVFQPWLRNFYVYFYGTPKGWETRKCIKRANMLTKQAVSERRKIRRLSLTQDPNEDFQCFLDHMLKLLEDGHLTENEVVQELNLFIAAGYDTSGIALTYTLFFLSFYSEHQQKIVDELCQIILPKYWANMKQCSVTTTMTKQMKYLEMCIKEALRLHPVVPISPRSTTRDVKLPNGHVIPKEADVFVMLNQIHRDPKRFPEPDKFHPERHLQPNPALLPFTLGSRNCIGQTYAMHELKVILAYLLMEYKWETTEKMDFSTTYQALLVPENGLRFKICKRVL